MAPQPGTPMPDNGMTLAFFPKRQFQAACPSIDTAPEIKVFLLLFRKTKEGSAFP
jgi:hypothetical protein